MALDDGQLYFGNYDEIKSINLGDYSVSSVGDIGGNADTSVVARHNGTTYVAIGTSYNEPYPYEIGYIDGTGDFNPQLEEDGIYDAAVDSQGDCYIVANPDALGSKIFTYDWDTGATTEIADIGGYSGSLAFDSAGNLYYADQGDTSRDAGILKFTTAQVEAGNLDVTDAEVVLDIKAGHIGFDDNGFLYATTGYGATFAMYDINTDVLVNEIAYGGIGKFLLDGDTIYAIDTDWDTYSSTIQMITVPEPATVVLIGLASLLLRRKRI
jgi:hypothetical protein